MEGRPENKDHVVHIESMDHLEVKTARCKSPGIYLAECLGEEALGGKASTVEEKEVASSQDGRHWDRTGEWLVGCVHPCNIGG